MDFAMAPKQVARVAEKTRNKFPVRTTDHSDRAEIVSMITEKSSDMEKHKFIV
jgi:hypothetical protein